MALSCAGIAPFKEEEREGWGTLVVAGASKNQKAATRRRCPNRQGHEGLGRCFAVLFPAMATPDAATEWRRLSELYGRMSDGELLALASKESELTELAQEALANEISQRRLKLEPEAPSEPPSPPRELNPAYDEDRRLVEICTVWSVADALQVQQLLDRAGIPFFMGPEKATGVDAVTSDFAKGVSVEIMNVGLAWARQALVNYEPANEPESERVEEPDEIPVRCPRCHSTEIVLDTLIGEESRTEKDSPQQFEWTCDACGHRWKDDGIVGEKP